MFASAVLILLMITDSNIGLDFAFVSGQSEKELLLELRNSLTYDSSVSSKLVHWNESIDFCRWGGVECDEKGRVSGLDLSGESISDGINGANSILFRLAHLQNLSLAQNNFFSVEFPSGFGQLTELRYLNLRGSSFYGQIPSDLSNLTRLVFLDLSSNPLGSGLQLPGLLRLIHNFTSLRELDLFGVNISASGNEWGRAISSSLPNLRVLNMHNSYITGPFHPSLKKLRYLSHIHLDYNDFSCPFPEFFADFPNLKEVTMSSCGLSGVVPAKIFQIKSMQTIVLAGNDNLGGSLPEFPVNGSLHTLVLGGPKFVGTLPESIGNLRMLSYFSIGGSSLSGSIPSTIKNLRQLDVLSLSENQFSGSVPSFAFLRNLSVIDLRGNSLTGTIPDTLWKGLDSLTNLDLSENLLEGLIPASLFLLPALKVVDLSNNRFSGLVEVSTNASSPLQNLHLSFNRFKGLIPRILFELRNLSTLYLISNKFSGSLELTDFRNLTNLAILDLSYNNLSVHVSEEASLSTLFPRLRILKLASCKLQKLPNFRNHSLLEVLNLSDNELDGDIPNWLWEVGNGSLRALDLSHNRFIHLQEPYDLRQLDYLNLSSNMLSGRVPSPSSAFFLDFSSNNFSSLPSDIGYSLGDAMFFSAADNIISSGIPPSFCNASRLEVLDLSSNRFHGGIPSCLLHDTLGVLNLSSNYLGGDISDTFPVGCRLKSIDLSRNFLRGKVPKSLTRCSELEALDLTSNKLNDSFSCRINTLSPVSTCFM